MSQRIRNILEPCVHLVTGALFTVRIVRGFGLLGNHGENGVRWPCWRGMVLTLKNPKEQTERKEKAKKELGSSLHPVEMAVHTGLFGTLAYSTCLREY